MDIQLISECDLCSSASLYMDVVNDMLFTYHICIFQAVIVASYIPT